uniref:Uncharacterized protein n=1 Tax=Rhizophora mucronata TaxID=61149 RepID=A0A2P2QI09_RHIMU
MQTTEKIIPTRQARQPLLNITLEQELLCIVFFGWQDGYSSEVSNFWFLKSKRRL